MRKLAFNLQIALYIAISYSVMFLYAPQLVRSQSHSTSCQAKAYVIDSDPKGLNVRRSPNARSSILGQLPLHTEVEILASQDNWLLVSPLVSEETPFPEKGWVFAPLLGLYTKGYGQKSVPLYDQPTEISKIVGQVPSDSEVTLLDCSGTWVRVKTSHFKGWLEARQQCSSPFTTCP